MHVQDHVITVLAHLEGRIAMIMKADGRRVPPRVSGQLQIVT